MRIHPLGVSIRCPLMRLSRRGVFIKLLVYLVPIFILFATVHHFISQRSENTISTQQLKPLIDEFQDAVDKNLALQKILQPMLNTSFNQRQQSKFLLIPVLVIACNRLGVRTTLDSLLRLRSQLKVLPKSTFPIYVSHACDHVEVSQLLSSYGDSIKVITPPHPLIDPSLRSKYNRIQFGYRHVAAHYKWALDQMFIQLPYNNLIVVEDDLDVAPDFFEYFASMLNLLVQDPSLFCISAWNDNGRPELVDNSRPDLLYRTDFFPGLGWMLLRSLWMQVRVSWPEIYWDEHMRQPSVRKNRSCIRPEISRSVTFGEVGVSQGQYFRSHLRYIELNKQPFNFLGADLTYLEQHIYDLNWHNLVYKQSVEISKADFLASKLPGDIDSSTPLRVTYITRQDFVDIAKPLRIMSDFKAGISRNAYRGVVAVMWNKRRLFIAPPPTWTGYNLSWV